MPEDIPQIKPKSILEPPETKSLPEADHELQTIPKMNLVVSENEGPKPVAETKDKKIETKKKKFKLSKRGAVILTTTLTSIFIIIFLLILFAALPTYALYKEGKVLADSARKLKDSTTSQDINIIESEYNNFKSEFLVFEEKFNKVYWMRRLPFLGGYVDDARHGLNAGLIALDTGDIAIETIKPYADIIGLGGEGSGSETANDRVEFLVNTIDEVLPRLDEINTKVAMIQSEVDKINTSKYPEEFRGTKIREPLTEYIQLLDEGAEFLVESKPLIERASYLLGVEDQRKYLLIFQNDKELRPTGGFVTAYSIISVDKGKVSNVRSSDIYDLDGNYTPAVEAPEVIRDYLKGPYLISDNYRLRDMNWNPDFKDSFELFMEEARDAGLNDEIDGVVAVDTQVVVNLLNAIGPIAVPGYGDFSTNNDERCNCPQVIYELESFADVEGPVVWNQDGSGEIIFAPENYGRRKEIIGPLMNSVLTNALGQPKEKMADLFEAGWRSVTEKHVLVYLFDEAAQSGAEGANLAGRINQDYEGDYLHVNDANLGGRKSNLYVTHEVTQDIEVAGDGSVTKTVTLTYANPQDYDGWLNSVLPNWTRVYVPQGAELLESEGFDEETQVYAELGKTVFAGGFELRPQGVKKITLKYKLPNKFNNEYNILIQKQPGKDFILHTLNVNKKTQETFLRTDKEFKFKI